MIMIYVHFALMIDKFDSLYELTNKWGWQILPYPYKRCITTYIRDAPLYTAQRIFATNSCIRDHPPYSSADVCNTFMYAGGAVPTTQSTVPGL